MDQLFHKIVAPIGTMSQLHSGLNTGYTVVTAFFGQIQALICSLEECLSVGHASVECGYAYADAAEPLAP